MGKFRDLTGQRFGALTVLELVPNSKRTSWRCKCDCGRETIVYAQSLLRGLTTSCGCHTHKMVAITGKPWSPRKMALARVDLKLDPVADRDIIHKLARVASKQGYIKRLIREDIKMGDTCLQDITRQESGIVVFENSDAIICNWAATGDGIPHLFAGVLVSRPCTMFALDQGETDDFESLGAGEWNVLYDENGDAPTLGETSSSWKWYKIKASDDIVTVIAPQDWN